MLIGKGREIFEREPLLKEGAQYKLGGDVS